MVAGLEQLNPDVARVLGGGAARASRSRQAAPLMEEEDERSLVGRLRDASLTTVGALGNFLDVPGSMVRDVGSMIATGKWVNPFDQLMSPLSSENRTSGKELLQQTGLASGRESWGKSIAGFGLEVATDPLTYLTFGASALGKAGQAAKKIGALDDIANIAARKQGRAAGTIGKREARLTTSMEDVARYGTGNVRERAQNLLKTLTPEEAAAPLGGLAGFGVPFKAPSKVFGTGPRSASAASAIDSMGRAIRFGNIPGTNLLNPVGAGLSLFDAKSGRARTAEVAALNRTLKDIIPESDVANRMSSVNAANFMEGILKEPDGQAFKDIEAVVDSRPWMQALVVNGNVVRPQKKFRDMTKAEQEMAMSDVMREGQENILDIADVPEPLRWIVDQMNADNMRAPSQMRRAGGRVQELYDDIGYSARFASSPKKVLTSKDLEASTFDPSQSYKRYDFLRQIPGGTVAFRREIAMDDDLIKLVKDKATKVEDVENYLIAKHSDWLPPTYDAFYKSGKKKGQMYTRDDRYKRMAEMILKQDPDVLKSGLFGNNVVFDHAARMSSHKRMVNTLESLTEFLTQKEGSAGRYIKPDTDWISQGVRVGTSDDQTMKLSKFLKAMDLPTRTIHRKVKTGAEFKGGMYKALAKKLGVSSQDISKMRIDKRIAEDLIAVHKATTTRGALDEILVHIDSFTNFTKSLLTGPWPGYLMRNMFGGYTENAMLGMWTPESAKWGVDIQMGKVLQGASKVQLAAEEYVNRARKAGMPDAEIVKQVASKGYSASQVQDFLSRAPKATTKKAPSKIEAEADSLLVKEKKVRSLLSGELINVAGDLGINITPTMTVNDIMSAIASARASKPQGAALTSVDRRADKLLAELNRIQADISQNMGRIAQGLGANVSLNMPPISIINAIKKSRRAAPKPLYAQKVGDFNDEFATEVLGQKAYADGVVGSVDADRLGSSVMTGERETGRIDDMLSGVPRAGRKTLSPYRAIRKFFGLETGTTIDPRKMGRVRGVYGRMQSEFGPVVAGEEVGAFIEGAVRLQPYFALLKRGYSSAEAAKRVAAAQVAYSNRNFTPFEMKVMARLFPFYKFSRSKIPFHFNQLVEKPGGPHAQFIRAMNIGQSQGELAPDYVRDTASIPVSEENPILSAIIGQAPEGTDRYVSGFGLMPEDLLSVGPGIRGTGQEVLSRLNPIVKGPLEYFTNQSFFQAGPEGGRRLDDMDPLVGRLLANITGSDEPIPTNPFMEAVVANSPFSRFLTTARTLTDPRKAGDYGALSEMSPVNLPGAPALLNLLTGVRVTDVSPGAKDAVVRDLLNASMKQAGARAFERVNFTKDDLAKMSPEEREVALELQALANTLVRRSKERARIKREQETN